jgi:hypothetical protein
MKMIDGCLMSIPGVAVATSMLLLRLIHPEIEGVLYASLPFGIGAAVVTLFIFLGNKNKQ